MRGGCKVCHVARLTLLLLGLLIFFFKRVLAKHLQQLIGQRLKCISKTSSGGKTSTTTPAPWKETAREAGGSDDVVGVEEADPGF